MESSGHGIFNNGELLSRDIEERATVEKGTIFSGNVVICLQILCDFLKRERRK